MDQSELLKLARASLEQRGRGRRQEQARAPVDGDAPPVALVEDGRTDNVERALSRIELLDQKLERISRVQEATASIAAAEARVLTMESVEDADASVAAMDRHIIEEHDFTDFEASKRARAKAVREAGRNVQPAIRDAFRFHLLLGPPKSLDF